MSLKHSVLQFKFDDFAGITESTGKPKCSEQKLDNQVNPWRLRLKTVDIEDSDPNDNDSNVALYLQNMGNAAITATFSIILRDSEGCVDAEFELGEYEFKSYDNWGKQLIKRSIVLDEKSNILRDKALHVDVHLQISSDDELMNKPPTSSADKFLKLLKTEEGADVFFKIKDAIIPAHKLMLRVNAPILFDSCVGKVDKSPITVDGITPEVFMVILRYIYAEEVPAKELLDKQYKDILGAANRFDLLGLKLAIEPSLVRLIRVPTAIEWLIDADSMTCALLKEAAMSFIIARSEDILNRGTFPQQLRESPELLIEVLQEVSGSSNNDRRFGDAKYFSVNQLRKRLHANGLDVDGTKEILIARFDQSNKRQKTERSD